MSSWLMLSLAALGLWGLWGVLTKVATQQVGPGGGLHPGHGGISAIRCLLGSVGPC